jgi:copper chaperone
MKYQFKTNINCGGCIAAVTPFLNGSDKIKHWEVDTQNPDKILTVETDDISAEKVSEIINSAGYKAQEI